MPWLPSGAYRSLLRELAEQRARVRRLEESRELELHEHRLAERHLCNQLLRKVGSFPQADKPTTPVVAPKPRQFEDIVDQGERDALIAAATSMGFENPAAEADRILREEHGFN